MRRRADIVKLTREEDRGIVVVSKPGWQSRNLYSIPGGPRPNFSASHEKLVIGAVATESTSLGLPALYESFYMSTLFFVDVTHICSMYIFTHVFVLVIHIHIYEIPLYLLFTEKCVNHTKN